MEPWDPQEGMGQTALAGLSFQESCGVSSHWQRLKWPFSWFRFIFSVAQMDPRETLSIADTVCLAFF